jgi:hypothetical protein
MDARDDAVFARSRRALIRATAALVIVGPVEPPTLSATLADGGVQGESRLPGSGDAPGTALTFVAGPATGIAGRYVVERDSAPIRRISLGRPRPKRRRIGVEHGPNNGLRR